MEEHLIRDTFRGYVELFYESFPAWLLVTICTLAGLAFIIYFFKEIWAVFIIGFVVYMAASLNNLGKYLW